MENKITLVKPEFNGDIKAEIVGISKIENNIMEVKQFAIQLNEYYSKTIWTPDTLADAKNEKANVNKFKDKIAEFRKNIIAEYKKPIELFETTAKETEKLLSKTYDTINVQVKRYEDETKEQIKQMCIAYFNECMTSKNIDFTTFEQMNMTITLGMQTKSGELVKKVKDEIMAFAERIEKDIELINSGDYVNETMVEYKRTLNASQSILDVKQRMQQIELEKQKQIELEKKREIEKQTIQNVENAVQEANGGVQNVNAPVEETTQKQYNVTFKVYGTLDELKQLKQYLVNGGYKYEQQ